MAAACSFGSIHVPVKIVCGVAGRSVVSTESVCSNAIGLTLRSYSLSYACAAKRPPDSHSWTAG